MKELELAQAGDFVEAFVVHENEDVFFKGYLMDVEPGVITDMSQPLRFLGKILVTESPIPLGPFQYVSYDGDSITVLKKRAGR
ncbi:hypothetical protein ACK8P5_25910 (plasmid) [Paenibacillus sp. EC2-1]|uniref:hypothetical protein n=1 Tax=Paenibacillus sp. EC2-1 TaxID=3388665 RepID=UPI003BEF1AD0